MRQYFAAKEQHPDCLMFCRIGDFYELFYDDAILVSRELQLTLTARDKEKKQPMCGVPYHAAEAYLQKLLRMGYKIALCEQMEDPKQTKTIVRREVTRVLTPGTALDPTLGAEQSNYLASVCVSGSGASQVCGLALLDLSTGEFRATEFSGINAWASLVDELGRVRPVELLYGPGLLGGMGTNGTLGLSEENKQKQNAGLLRSAQNDSLERGTARTPMSARGWMGFARRQPWMSGCLRRSMRCHWCGITSKCIRWMGWGWVGMSQQRWRRERCCTTCDRPSRVGWSMSMDCGFMSGRIV